MDSHLGDGVPVQAEDREEAAVWDGDHRQAVAQRIRSRHCSQEEDGPLPHPPL
jgi:hypothetical protein